MLTHLSEFRVLTISKSGSKPSLQNLWFRVVRVVVLQNRWVDKWLHSRNQRLGRTSPPGSETGNEGKPTANQAFFPLRTPKRLSVTLLPKHSETQMHVPHIERDDRGGPNDAILVAILTHGNGCLDGLFAQRTRFCVLGHLG